MEARTLAKPHSLPERRVVAGLLFLALLSRLPLLYLRGFEIFHADQAVIGLMAHHILQGKWMVYFYGQGYMGSLEAFVAAPVFLLGGMNLFSLQLAPLLFYLLFLLVNFQLLKEAFGFEVSLMANLFLVFSPAELTRLSVIALGGYPETLFFGSLTLLGLIRASGSEKPGKILFLTGLAAGVGFWVNNLILVYFIAAGIFCFLRSETWKKTCETGDLRKLFLLQYETIPPALRFAGLAIHLWIFWFCFWQIVSFFNSGQPISLGPLTLKAPSLPFEVKKIKRILLFLSGEFIVLGTSTVGGKRAWGSVKKILPLVAGFLMGGSPGFLYTLLGGEGYRVIHGSGIIFAKDLVHNLRFVLWNGWVTHTFEVPTQFLGQSGWMGVHAWAVFALTSGLFLYFLYLHKKELGPFFRLRFFPYPYSFFPFVLTVVVLLICLLSTLQSGRYMIAVYFSVSLIFALALSHLKNRIGKWAWFFLLILLAHNVYANCRFIVDTPRQEATRRGHEAILKFLESRGVRGGYAHYITSYVLTFESGEKMIFAPYRSPDRYPAYTQFVDGLERAAYLFEETNPFVPSFQQTLNQNKISYEKSRQGPFLVFIIDRRAGTEKGKV